MVDYKEFGEYLTIKRLITEVYPSGIVSLVSDSYDFWRVLTKILPKLKQDIMARSGNPIANKVVIRPDSGDPVKVICGYKDHEIIKHTDGKIFVAEQGYTGGIDNVGYPKEGRELSVAEVKGAIECLWDVFGGTVNSKGYKVLDPHIGLIYGDSITPVRAQQILAGLEAKGFASTNVVFGIGSYTYQYATRDTYGFAVKATAGKVNGELREIFKDPATDVGKTKKSAKGLLEVRQVNGEYELHDQLTEEQWLNSPTDMLKTVFKDGQLLVDVSLAEIRESLKRN